jgi:predicted dehydrogenase
MTQFRIGLIGCGRLAERGYVPAARRAEGVVLAAVADLEPDRCRQGAPGVPAFTHVDELLASVELDAVVIATPPSAHLAVARQVARAQLPLLVEKPPADRLDEAVHLAALEPSPWIAFNRRFLLGLEQARIDAIAETSELELELRYPRGDWAPHSPPPDALLDAGSHLVDLARWLAGADVRRVRAHALTKERAAIELDLGHVRARLGCAVDLPHRERFRARTARGRVLFRYEDGGVWRALLRRLRSPREDNPFLNSLARQLDALARAVRGDGPCSLATAADGVGVMAAVEAARRSSSQGGSWQSVDVASLTSTA